MKSDSMFYRYNYRAHFSTYIDWGSISGCTLMPLYRWFRKVAEPGDFMSISFNNKILWIYPKRKVS